MKYHSALKRKDILTPDPTWMNLEDRMLPSKISQTQVKYCYDGTARRSLEEPDS